MPTVVKATKSPDDQPFLCMYAEHLPVERLGPTGIKHHEVAVTDGRRHRITDHPAASQTLRTRPRCQGRSSNRDGHLGRFVPHRLARPRREPHVRGERDRHGLGFRRTRPTCLDSTRVVTYDRTVRHHRPHFRRDRITACGCDRPHQPLRVTLQVRPRSRFLVFAVVGVDAPEAVHRLVWTDTQAEAEGVADLRGAEQVGRMPPQHGADRVARKPSPAGRAYRRLSGLGQAIPDDLLKVPRFHCGIDTTIPIPATGRTPIT